MKEEVLSAQLPANVDAEKTILGAVLLDQEALEEVKLVLRPADFFLDSHKRIAAAMGRLSRAERAIDIVTLANELTRTHEMEAIGGVAYLAALTEGLPRRPRIDEYTRIVKDKSVARLMMQLCAEATERFADGEESALEITADIGKRMEALTAATPQADHAKVENFVVEVLDEINKEFMTRESPCIPSGNAWFDFKTGGGYRHGKITIVAARPKVGKTSWFLQSAAYNLRRGRKVVMFSLEMERREILQNLIPHFSTLPNIVASRPHLQTPEQNRILNETAMKIAEDMPLMVYDGDMDCDEVCWSIDRESKDGKEVLFGLDHFGLMGGTGKDIRSRYVDNSNRLRRKIKHKNAALVALFQLTKVAREHANKPPMPGDVKESGNPAEDCFAMLLLHRYFEENDQKMSKKANLNLAYLRGAGSTGSIDGEFNTKTLSFEAQAELEYEDDGRNDYFA